jgi:hypothetical protein
VESRAAARPLLDATQKKFRIILSTSGGPRPPNLEQSTCQRQIWPDGSLFELLMLDGSAEDLTDEQLDTFTGRFPIMEDRTSATLDYGQEDGSDA